MVPKKLRVVAKFLLIFILLLGLRVSLLTVTSHVSTSLPRQHKAEPYHPIASLYYDGVQPIISEQCRGHVSIHNRVMVMFRNVTLDASKAHAEARGGAEIAPNIVTQKESAELFDVTRGFLQLPCQDNDLNLNDKTLLSVNGQFRRWRDSIVTTADDSSRDVNASLSSWQRGLTIILERNEYANVYWTLMDFYDVYITMRYFDEQLNNTHIILADAHPRGHLDELWASFRSMRRLQDITSPTLIERLSWRYDRQNSPFLKETLRNVPLVEDFRQFVITSQRSRVYNTPLADCTHLRVLFIWRHDYVAHPRNPSGQVARKIANERQLLNATRAHFRSHSVDAVQLDNYDVRQQVELVANTDVMMGMHGAAMAFSLLLPRHAAVVELYPHYYGYANWHMKKLARWSHHKYFSYKLPKALDDLKTFSTTVPVDVAIELLTKALQAVCKERLKHGSQ